MKLKRLLKPFAFSIFATLGVLLAVALGLGLQAVIVTVVLIVIEVTFSFDNAIINAKTLGSLSPFWQKLFLSVGIIIAIFGMRIIFPIVIVMLTAGLSWHDVVHLALHDPTRYAHDLEAAHPTIAAFGGIFLLMLALNFFLDDGRKILWLDRLERQLQRLASWWMPPLLALLTLCVVVALPSPHRNRIFVAGLIGILTYQAIHLLISLAERFGTSLSGNGKKVGLAAFTTFIYLEVLDASFSFDGVIGAFAITSSVVLIAAGLGAGAVWVRSFTVFMTRQGTLDNYKYLEHGAHYTVALLALLLLASLFLSIPDVVSGVAGIVIIALSARASIAEKSIPASSPKRN